MKTRMPDRITRGAAIAASFCFLVSAAHLSAGEQNPHDPAFLQKNRPRSTNAPSSHWAFQAVRRPPVPTNSKSAASPIDAFVAAKLREKSTKLQSAADRRTLVRRAYFDLIGLPPSPEEVATFVADDDPRAYERLIDRLLESPHYGERWGRHWLDVAGFAESSMFIGDVPRQGFWRYRDYVIRAFNADKPYDQFVTEQLA